MTHPSQSWEFIQMKSAHESFLYPYVCNTSVHNSWDVEPTPMPINWSLDKENGVYTYYGALHSHKTMKLCLLQDRSRAHGVIWNPWGQPGRLCLPRSNVNGSSSLISWLSKCCSANATRKLCCSPGNMEVPRMRTESQRFCGCCPNPIGWGSRCTASVWAASRSGACFRLDCRISKQLLHFLPNIG